MSFLFLAQNFQGRGEQKEWNGNDQKKERRVRQRKKQRKSKERTRKERRPWLRRDEARGETASGNFEERHWLVVIHVSSRTIIIIHILLCLGFCLIQQ
jgi:hypothetical protein